MVHNQLFHLSSLYLVQIILLLYNIYGIINASHILLSLTNNKVRIAIHNKIILIIYFNNLLLVISFVNEYNTGISNIAVINISEYTKKTFKPGRKFKPK